MTVKYHENFIQGSEEWHAARCGLLTASEMKLILTPTLKIASNDKERTHLYELLAQRITQYVEPSYIGDNMLRGWDDEVEARILYSANYEPVEECGFITNDKFGFTIGYSPDGIVGDDGLIECKSRVQKYQIQTIADFAAKNEIASEFMFQVQTGLLVSERKWCDFISYSAGLPMVTTRVFPDLDIQGAILDAATKFEKRLSEKHQEFIAAAEYGALRLIPTERREEEDMIV